MDPGTIAGLIGLGTSIFGGSKPTTPEYLKRNYRLSNSIMSKAIDLYDSTDLEDLDGKALKGYSDQAMKFALAALQNHDAALAGGGVSLAKSDTKGDRSRTQVAGDVSRDVADKEFQLNVSRPNRKHALLPSAAENNSLAGTAERLDQYNMAEADSEMNGLLNMSKLVAQLFGKKGAVSGVNDALGAASAGVGQGIGSIVNNPAIMKMLEDSYGFQGASYA